MSYRYTLRAVDTKVPTKPLSLARVLTKLVRRIGRKGPHTLTINGNRRDHKLSSAEMLRDVRRRFTRGGGSMVIVVHPSRGRSQVLKKKEHSSFKPVDTPGTLAIDKIFTGVHRKFDEKWTVRDMGMSRSCVDDRSSEHCPDPPNAWDFGTDVDVPAEVTGHRITVMAKWLRRQGLLNIASGGKLGLPVNGIVVMDRYWRRGVLAWQHYTGEKHVSHVHVSGHPPYVPGFV